VGLRRGQGPGTYLVEPDRRTAIGMALSMAGTGDMIVIAGKGHEDYQIYGDTRRSFSDRREAQRHLGVAA
jgi:UDP-N-acetylmuramyl tripeptide synthase